MLDKLEAIQERFYYLEERLSDPSIVSDQKLYAKTNKDYSNLKEVVEVYKEYKELLGNIETAKEMLAEDDPDMKEMAKEELNELNPKKAELEEKLKILLIPKDPEDEKDVIVEIRSGTGGDEASIFAGDLYKMYSRFFDRQKWKVEVLNITEGSVGGYSKLVLEVSGNNVYGRLKFESGAHRVQRVPKNINKADLRTDTFRASGAGGQHVNKTESGVRFTHIPTGIVAESTDARSQTQNREIAIQRLYQKMYDVQREAHNSKVAAARKSLIGSGDRSGKIRTYNYPQNRVTDHRINLTLYSLDKIVEGDIDGILEALQVAENAEKMKAGAEME